MPRAQAHKENGGEPAAAEPPDAAAVAKRYTEDGWSLLECARALGVSEPTARKTLARLGVTIRKPGGPSRARSRDVAVATRRRSIGRHLDPFRRLSPDELQKRIDEKIRADLQRLLDEAAELEDLLSPVTAGRP